MHRPDYPDQAVEWALASVPHGATVLDLGAGTGKLTAAIMRCGVPTAAVLAVEPDDGMRAELARRLPGVAVLRGSAEQIPAEEGAVDAVFVGQAFHWFDPDRALPEIARVLRPGGVLVTIGNIEDDSVGWVAELAAVTQTVRSAGSIGLAFADVPQHPAFGKPEQRRFHWRWPRTIDSLLATVSTHSWTLVSGSEERAAALTAIRRFLEQHPATRDGAFDLPMQTLVHRATRRA